MFCARVLRVACVTALATLMVASEPAEAQSRTKTAELHSVHVTPGEFGPVLDVFATGSLTPKIQTVENPLRLVIDLPGSTLGSARTRIAYRNEQIKGIRVSQYQSSPAVTRIVVDLAAPVLYRWDAAGDHLHIRIRPDEAAQAKPPTVPAFTAGTQPAAVPVAVGNSGTLVETGSRVASGSSITAGDDTAVLRLARGGEVRVCPGTTVSVTTSATGQELMLGMSKGAMETHYALQESTDSVLTPDFRIVMPGPGEFNLAINADDKGNTCVASMPGSTASAVIAELLGTGTYEIKPEQQVLFRQGRLDTVETPVASCGCPPPAERVLRTAVDPSHVVPEEKAGDKLQLASSSDETSNGGVPNQSPLPATDQPAKDDPAKTQVDSPLVFSGADIAKAREQAAQSQKTGADVPPAPTQAAAALRPTEHAPDPSPTQVVLPPEPQPKAKKGFFGKIKGFFGAIFR